MIIYDKYGRMQYNEEFHSKNGTKWSKEDLQYLIEWYDVAGAEEMSYALDRTKATIAHKVGVLRKKGIMKKTKNRMSFKNSKING